MKASKEAASYRSKSIRGANRRCALCTMFRAPSSCTSVEGTISPKGDCAYFKRKKVKETA